MNALYMRPMTTELNTNFPFMKMHGLGNDFVVLDARGQGLALAPALIQRIADRNRGVGFDQLAVINNGKHNVHLTFYNVGYSALNEFH